VTAGVRVTDRGAVLQWWEGTPAAATVVAVLAALVVVTAASELAATAVVTNRVRRTRMRMTTSVRLGPDTLAEGPVAGRQAATPCC
jgi:hypothetical protein